MLQAFLGPSPLGHVEGHADHADDLPRLVPQWIDRWIEFMDRPKPLK
jgi:hypothetical protein